MRAGTGDGSIPVAQRQRGRGLEAIHGGWINNIVIDNAGARYKGGTTRGLRNLEAGPVLDVQPGESRCVAGRSPDGPLPATAVLHAEIAPALTAKTVAVE